MSRVNYVQLDAPDDGAISNRGGLLIDAYASQHHGSPSPQAIQSVGVHLLTLHGVIRHGQPAEQALWIRRRCVRKRGVFRWLEPPPPGSALTVRHLFPGGGVATPVSVGQYVVSVYQAWEQIHGRIIGEWYERYVVAD